MYKIVLDTAITPLEGSDMTYDFEEHQYQLTKEFIEKELAVTLGIEVDGSDNILPFLKNVRRTVYRWLYSQQSPLSIKPMEYMIVADINEYGISPRQTIKMAMLAQAHYHLNYKVNLDAESQHDGFKIISKEAIKELENGQMVTRARPSFIVKDEVYRVGY